MPSISATCTAHGLAQGGRDVLADVVGADRQLPVPAVDQHGQTDRAGSAELGQRVERGADRPAVEQHVVDEDDDLVVDAPAGHHGVLQGAGRPAAQVVAVHRDVQRADGHVGAGLDAADPLGDALRQRDTAAGDAEQDQIVGALLPFEDLVGDPGQRTSDVVRVEHAGGHTHSFPASRDGR